MPFPVQAFEHNTFFDFAGDLIGLIVIFSLLIPLARMLRSLVLEKEDKLREHLLIMGASLPAYYGSLLLMHGITFFACALIAAAELGPSCFQHSDTSIVVLLFSLFALSSMSFTLALTPFFRSARLAALVGPLLFFLTSLLYNIFLERGVLLEGLPRLKAAASLLPAMGFYLGASAMSKYESSQQGVTWSNINEGAFPLSVTLFILALDVLLYSMLAWYLDQVVPSEYGIQRKPWFVLSPEHWTGGADSPGAGYWKGALGTPRDASDHAPPPLAIERLEPIDAASLAGQRHGGAVRTRGLCKVYPRGVAVHRLDLEMRSGQITALLGANGAGKTTTISMLTGLIPPDAGDAHVNGLSILSSMPQIRSSIGVCPQQNVLFGQLSVQQHLELYAELKGLRSHAAAAAIDALLGRMDLAARRHARSAALSGGQKRKLCLAIALIGNSRTLFLDEPTSGMDPHSRRAIWALLREQREGRTIVLTTHFLDEAELLADRIAIMAEGALRCVGSVLFLKAQFGVGYRLSLIKHKSRFDAEASLDMVRSHVPGAVLLSDSKLEQTISLPGDDLRAYQALVAELEAGAAALGVTEFGVGCTSLEDVFLKINESALDRLHAAGRAHGDSEARSVAGGSGAGSSTGSASMARSIGDGSVAGGSIAGGGVAGAPTGASLSDAVDGLSGPSPPVLRPGRLTSSDESVGSPSGGIQMRSLLPRDGTVPEMLSDAPGSRTSAFGGKSLRAMRAPLAAPGLRSDGGGWGMDGGRGMGSGGGGSGGWLSSVRVGCAHAASQYIALFTKRRLSAQRSPLTTGCLLLFPVLLVLLALLLLGVLIAFDQPRLSLSHPPDVFAPYIGHSLLPANNQPTDAQLDSLAANGWGVDTSPSSLYARQPRCADTFPEVAQNLSAFLLRHPDNQHPVAYGDSRLKVQWEMPNPLEGDDGKRRIVTLAFNATSTHALPALVNSLYSNLYAEQTGGEGSIAASAQSLPATSYQQDQISAFSSLFVAIMIMIPFAFTAASFVSPLVAERGSGSKQLQMVAGTSGVVYWLASWTWDAIMYSMVVLCTMAAFLAMERNEFTGSHETTRATVAMLFLFGFATLPFSSLASFFYRSSSSALIALVTVNFLSGFGLLIADFVLMNIDSTKDINALLRPLYNLAPAYCLGKAFLTLATRSLFVTFGVEPTVALFDWGNLGRPAVYLFAEGVTFSILTLLLQTLAPSVGCDGCLPPAALRRRRGVDPTTLPRSLEDDSVAAERAAVDAAEDSLTDAPPLVLRHLSKRYGTAAFGGGKLAVADLCLRVESGECFGFLGVNGAGKSTTFAMLTGAVTPTAGDAFLHGMSSRRDQRRIRRLIGYCPQHDALQSLMTGRETLRMYARIKLVPRRQIEAEVAELLRDLDLLQFADKPAGTYSGGNKRKLCVGIALVGRPSLVLLDEPSSGMDAASKRFLWAVIKRRTRDCCTVLTTHSMEECEALCGRIGVMVDGVLRCIGPIQTLKTRYGQGFKLDLRLAPDALHEAAKMQEYIEQRCGARLEEFEPPGMTLTVPQRGAALSALFGVLADARELFSVSECSVTQCTLEQIFILMASKQQLHRGDEPIGDEEEAESLSAPA
jgi:ABC-type multidrug transport system ATPase subunit